MPTDAPLERLPCGCEIGTAYENGVPTLFYRPCSTTCDYYAYVIEESRKQAKPIETRHEHDRR